MQKKKPNKQTNKQKQKPHLTQLPGLRLTTNGLNETNTNLHPKAIFKDYSDFDDLDILVGKLSGTIIYIRK